MNAAASNAQSHWHERCVAACERLIDFCDFSFGYQAGVSNILYSNSDDSLPDQTSLRFPAPSAMDSAPLSNGDGSKPVIGVYTKTTIQSSVVRFIIHARIRHPRLNDVVFVGNNFIHVKHVGHRGHLSHVAFKNDFDSPIRNAASFPPEKAPDDEDFLVKLEKDNGPLENPAFPSQSVVLTLDTDLVFIFLQSTGRGEFEFVQQIVPMHKYDRLIYQPGHYLAVDPHSRALAVSAQEREIIIYAAKTHEQIQHEICGREKVWCPVSSERHLAVAGVVQQVSFLVPPDDDPDRIILLVVVIDKGLTKAIQIDWTHSTGPIQAQQHPGLPLDGATEIPSLLIALQDAAFLLVTGFRMTIWKNILSGSTLGNSLAPVDDASQYPGNSGSLPVWTSWAKPQRSQAARSACDDIYLVREDGLVLYMKIPKSESSRVTQSVAGSLGCHVGTAFASLGGELDPDILCVAGDTSSGLVVSIGNWPSARRIGEMSRMDTMGIKPIELIPNWASVTDMIPSDVIHTNRSRIKETDSMFVTSGREPYGAITELRQGLEGIAAAFVRLDFCQAVTGAWVLPDLSMGSLIVVLSSPLETTLWRLHAEFASLPDYHPDSLPKDVTGISAFDTKERTLVAAITSDNIIVQVTPKSICMSQALHANFEDTFRRRLAEDEEILAASIIPAASKVVVAVQCARSFGILCYSVAAADDDAMTAGPRVDLTSQPLCIASTMVKTDIVALASTSNGRLLMLCFGDSSSAPVSYDTRLPPSSDQAAPCDHIVLLESDNIILAVCGLRNGTLVSFIVEPNAEKPLTYLGTSVVGSSTVRLASMTSDQASAVAMTGNSTLLISWSGRNRSLRIENIWITDKAHPEFVQGSVVATCQIPAASYLSSDEVAEQLLLVSGDSFIVIGLDSQSSTVPRQLPTSGTPNRLVYAEPLRHLVCSGMRYDVRVLPSRPRSPPEERRQLWPFIDFIAVQRNRPDMGDIYEEHSSEKSQAYTGFTHELQPGEKVNALLSWSPRLDSEKKISWILLGGSYLRKNGLRRGKVTFLQPKVKSREVVDVTVTRQEYFDQDVTALAVFDDRTYAVCAGNKVYLYRLDVQEMKWTQICPAFLLASAGVYMTVEDANEDCRQMVITTAADSVVNLCLVQGQGDDASARLQPVCLGPRADYLISHYVLPRAVDNLASKVPMVLAGGKDGKLIGMTISMGNNTAASVVGSLSAVLQFEAQLGCSITRLRPSATIARKGERPAGLASNRILGSATDGTIIALATIDETTWRKLFWLQRLIERSEHLSPYSHMRPLYSPPGDDVMVGSVRAVPIGFRNSGNEMTKTMLQTTVGSLTDMHIDGDILARIFQKGGVEAVRTSMRDFAAREGNAGSWLAAHLEEELHALDEVVDLVKKLDAWL